MSQHPDLRQRLAGAAAQVAAQRRAIAADPRLSRRTRALKQWQAARLARTHADLLADPDSAPAARFFLDDLYGAKDFSRRDAELLRLLPTMSRLLPVQALETVADAIELDALTEGLDESLAGVLAVDDPAWIDEAGYAAAYRRSGSRPAREHQLDLVMRIGRSLEILVGHPVIATLLRAMALPARVAGLSEMHEFLLRGFEAFRVLPTATGFLARIQARERAILERIHAGDDTGWISVDDSS